MTKKVLSIILATILLLSVLPLTVTAADVDTVESGIPEGTIPGTTGTGTQAYPIVADTFAELKAALEYNAELYIVVNSFQKTTGLSYYGLRAGTDYTSGNCAINEKNTKHLTLNTNIDIRANDTGTSLYSFIAVFGNVEVNGTGSLNVSFNSGGNPNAIFMVYSPGSLTVDQITLDPSPMGVSVHGVSIWNYTGTVTINSGTFKGVGHNYGSGTGSGEGHAVVNNRGTMTIYRGTFEARGGTKNYGLFADTNVKSTVLMGGVYTGIRNATGKLSALVPAGYVFKNVPTGITFDGTTVSSYTDQVQVINGNAVYNIDVNVTAPSDGKTSTAPTLTGTDVTLHQYEWQDLDAAGWPGTSVQFIAGHQYKLTMVVYPAQGKEIPESDDLTITVNGDKNVVKNGLAPGGSKGYVNFSYYFICPISTVNLTLDLSQPNSDATVDNSAITVTQTQWNKTSEEGDYKIYCRIESSQSAFQEDTKVYINDTYLTQIDFCSESVIVCSAEVFTGSSGSTVSGTETSFLSDSETVTVQLLQSGSVKYSATTKGKTASYSIPNVANGAYTLRVSKKNHVTRDYSITVSGNTKQDVKIHPIGDVDGDGAVNNFDYGRVNSHARNKSKLTDYAFLCADIDGDGYVNNFDAGRVNSHARGKSSLWT